MSKKSKLLLVLCSLSVTSIIVSNIITNKPIPFLGLSVTCGSFLMPVSYIVNDTLVEVYGFKTGRMVTVISFLCNLIAVIFYEATILAPGDMTFTFQSDFVNVLGQSPRVLFASVVSYIVGSLINAWIMEKLHERDGENRLMFRCILSTIAGEMLDMIIFVLLAFSGRFSLDTMISIIIGSAIIKILVETIVYAVATRHVISWAKTLQD